MLAAVCLRYGPPDVLEVRQMEKPEIGKDEVCVRVAAAAVAASDCIVRGFRVSARYRIPMGLALGFGRPRNPVLGMVFSGVVEKTGKECRLFRLGDRVAGFDRFGFGAYAEYKRMREDGLMVKLPDGVAFAEAAAVPYGGLIAMSFLRSAGALDGKKVLIYGASGAVGTAAVQLARQFGADVTGVCSGSNAALVASLGAGRVIDYTAQDFTTEEIRYDLIFNAVGKDKARLNCRAALTKNGQHITVDDGAPKLRRDDLNFLMRLLEKGEWNPVIDRSYALEQIAQAHAYVETGHKRGNVIVRIDEMQE